MRRRRYLASLASLGAAMTVNYTADNAPRPEFKIFAAKDAEQHEDGVDTWGVAEMVEKFLNMNDVPARARTDPTGRMDIVPHPDPLEVDRYNEGYRDRQVYLDRAVKPAVEDVETDERATVSNIVIDHTEFNPGGWAEIEGPERMVCQARCTSSDTAYITKGGTLEFLNAEFPIKLADIDEEGRKREMQHTAADAAEIPHELVHNMNGEHSKNPKTRFYHPEQNEQVEKPMDEGLLAALGRSGEDIIYGATPLQATYTNPELLEPGDEIWLTGAVSPTVSQRLENYGLAEDSRESLPLEQMYQRLRDARDGELEPISTGRDQENIL